MSLCPDTFDEIHALAGAERPEGSEIRWSLYLVVSPTTPRGVGYSGLIPSPTTKNGVVRMMLPDHSVFCVHAEDVDYLTYSYVREKIFNPRTF